MKAPICSKNDTSSRRVNDVSKTKKVVYLCHEFKRDPEGNIARVEAICKRIIEEVTPLPPHMFLPRLVDDNTQRALAMEHCINYLEGCKELWICSTHVSSGMEQEIAHATVCGIPVLQKAERFEDIEVEDDQA